MLEDLKKCNSFLVWHNLASVAAELTHKFPIDQVATWLSGSTEILNIDKRKLLLDDRSTSIVFLRRLMKMDLYDASSRLTNGYEKPDIDEIVIKLSHLSSFEIAIGTWISICREWLSICNTDHITQVLEKMRPIHKNETIAKLMVAAQELALD